MPCCTYYSDYEVEQLDADLKLKDPELYEVLEECRKLGATFFIHRREWHYKKWFRAKVNITHEVLSPTIKPEYQIINFGPLDLNGDSICFDVSRQSVAGYLFGFYNGAKK